MPGEHPDEGWQSQQSVGFKLYTFPLGEASHQRLTTVVTAGCEPPADSTLAERLTAQATSQPLQALQS
jgi:hypothetical protein